MGGTPRPSALVKLAEIEKATWDSIQVLQDGWTPREELNLFPSVVENESSLTLLPVPGSLMDRF